MMDVTELNAYLDRHFTRAAFRSETLQTYEVLGWQDCHLHRFTAGIAPTASRTRSSPSPTNAGAVR